MKNRRPTSSPGFDEFWAAYPRCINRAGALRSYQRAANAHGHHVIMAGLRSYPFKEGFIPHPTTWLNQSRFLGYEEHRGVAVVQSQDRGAWMNAALGWTTEPVGKTIEGTADEIWELPL